MTSPDPRQVEAQLASMSYPTAQDEQIRQYADFIGAHGINALLDRLRIFVAGDITRVLHLARDFAGNGTSLTPRKSSPRCSST